MKELNKRAKDVLFKLMQTAKTNGGHTKIDNAPGHYMAACVEIIGDAAGYELVSVAHYGEQNGDLMRDPDIVIMANEQTAWPISYRNDYVCVFHEAADFDEAGRLKSYRPRMQRDITACANMLLRNIADQQGI
jgi:hypothetical protein